MNKQVDVHLVIAILIAPILWLLMFLMWQPILSWSWPLQYPIAFLMPVLVYPILEEIVFRGALQGWFEEKSWGTLPFIQLSYANILTSFIFSTFHLYNHAPLWAMAVFVPSLIFGYFRDRYVQNGFFLAVPIFLHCYYNMGWFWLFNTL